MPQTMHAHRTLCREKSAKYHLRTPRDDRKASSAKNKQRNTRSQTSSTANYKLNRIKSMVTTLVTTIIARRRTLAKTPPLFMIRHMRKIFYNDVRNCNVESDKQRLLPHSRMRRAGSLVRFSLALSHGSDLSACLIAARDESQPRNTGPRTFHRVFSDASELAVLLSSAPAELSSCNS